MQVIDRTLIGLGKALMEPGAYFLKVGLEFWQRAAVVTEHYLRTSPLRGALGEGEGGALLSSLQPVFDLFLAAGLFLAVIAFALGLFNETADLRSRLNPRDIFTMLTRLLLTLFLVSSGMELALSVTDLTYSLISQIPAKALSGQGSLDHLSGRLFEKAIERAFFTGEGERKALDVEGSGEAFAFVSGIQKEIREYTEALKFFGEIPSADGEIPSRKRSMVCPSLTLGEVRNLTGKIPSPGTEEVSDAALRAWAALRPGSFQKLWKKAREKKEPDFDLEREEYLSFLRALRAELFTLSAEEEAALKGRLTSLAGDVTYRTGDAANPARLSSHYVSGMTVGELYLLFGSGSGYQTLGGYVRHASPADEAMGVEDPERMERFAYFFISYLLEDEAEILLRYGVFAGVVLSLKDAEGGGDTVSGAKWAAAGLLAFTAGLTLGLAAVISGFEILQASLSRIFRMILILPMAPVSFAHLSLGREGINQGFSWLFTFFGYAAEAFVFALSIGLSFALLTDFTVDTAGMGVLEMTVVELIGAVMPVICCAGVIRGAEKTVRDILGTP